MLTSVIRIPSDAGSVADVGPGYSQQKDRSSCRSLRLEQQGSCSRCGSAQMQMPWMFRTGRDDGSCYLNAENNGDHKTDSKDVFSSIWKVHSFHLFLIVKNYLVVI